MFHIVQPCANGPRRFEHATIVSSHAAVKAAFEELAHMTTVLHRHGISGLAVDLVVVTDDMTPIRDARQQHLRSTTNWIAPTALSPEFATLVVPEEPPPTLQTKIAPTAGWDFSDRAPVAHAALMTEPGGTHVQVWWIEPSGASIRMRNVEAELLLSRPKPIVRSTPSEHVAVPQSVAV